MSHFSDYNLKVDDKQLVEDINQIKKNANESENQKLFQEIYSLIDLTSLDVADNESKIRGLVEKVNAFNINFPGLANVAAICVYPSLLPVVVENLTDLSVRKATVAASFPSSQTFPEIKKIEVQLVLKEKADEIDIVIPVGKFLEGRYDEITEEIREIKDLTGDKHLKVILETGVIKDLEKIKLASFICLEAGADFIKTSTGKNGPGASLEAVYVMCEAIREYYEKQGRSAGIKPAGGISDPINAVEYYLLVQKILGNNWLNPSRFRIGASRLANNLLGKNYF